MNLIQDRNGLKTLELKQELSLLNKDNDKFILFNKMELLDDLFWSFNSTEAKIAGLQKIIINQPDLNGSTLNNLYNLRNNIEFFKNNQAQNKQIEISNQFHLIEYSDFGGFKNELASKSITITRSKPSAFDFLTSNTLDLDKLYANSITQNQNNLYRYLLGFEDQIQTIQKSNSVTEIKDGLFYNMQFKHAVTLDLTNIREIKSNAFYQTQNLNFAWPTTSVLTKVGQWAFYGTSAKLTNTTLAKVVEIGDYAFASTRDHNVTELDLSAATAIGNSAFSNAQNLTKIKFNQQLTTIGNSAFSNAGLRSLTLPNSVNTINDYAFANNQIVSANLDLSHVNTIGASAFNRAGRIDQIQFANNLQTIKNNAFSNIQLKQLTIPPSVKTIEASAFASNIIQVTNLNLASVTTIGDGAFANAGTIETLTLTSVTQIDANAFSNLGLKTLTLPTTLTTIGQNAFSNNNLTTVSGINFDRVDLEAAFGSTVIQSNTNLNPPTDYQGQIGYDSATTKLDLSKTNNLNSTKMLNFLKLLLKEQKSFSEVVLPNNVDQNLINLLTTGTTINKLTWNAPSKTMNFTLANKTNIKSLDSNFTASIISIPENAFANMNMTLMQNQSLSLINVSNVGQSAFRNSGIKQFSNTESLKEINSLAFDYNVTLALPADVKLKDDAFSASTDQKQKLPPTVSRDQIFQRTSKYWEIYDQNSKILDFTKAKISGQKFFSKQDWNDYLNIGQYLLDGDVQKVILPPVYVIWDGFVDQLGTVETVVFHFLNQQIYTGAFNGTIVQTKPEQNQTNIIYDGAGFFVK